MAIISKSLDPVRGLISYVETIKPYHSKIIEVLEEYIQTDYIYVTIKDSINFCFNLGFPNLDTMFAYDITSINDNIISVSGKTSNTIFVGQRISIEFSDNNNGEYYVVSTSYNIYSNSSTIEFDKSLPSPLVDGKIVNSIIRYCPDSDNISTNILNLASYCDNGYGSIFDSVVTDVLDVNLTNNIITIDGNHTTELNTVTTVLMIDASPIENEHIATFHIDSVYFNGTNTEITVKEEINDIPGYINSNTFKLSIKYIEFDQLVCISDIKDRNNSETLYVKMIEEVSFDIGIEYNDDTLISMTDAHTIDVALTSTNIMNISIPEEFDVSNEFVSTPESDSSNDNLITTITDNMQLSWGNITDWFQYYIIKIIDVNSFSVGGNATGDIQIGQEIRIIGLSDNIGVYTVVTIQYNSNNTIITIFEDLPSLTDIGYVEPVDILPMRLLFNDNISATVVDDTRGEVLDNSGNIVNSMDYRYFDIGGYDGYEQTNM